MCSVSTARAAFRSAGLGHFGLLALELGQAARGPHLGDLGLGDTVLRPLDLAAGAVDRKAGALRCPVEPAQGQRDRARGSIVILDDDVGVRGNCDPGKEELVRLAFDRGALIGNVADQLGVHLLEHIAVRGPGSCVAQCAAEIESECPHRELILPYFLLGGLVAAGRGDCDIALCEGFTRIEDPGGVILFAPRRGRGPRSVDRFIPTAAPVRQPSARRLAPRCSPGETAVESDRDVPLELVVGRVDHPGPELSEQFPDLVIAEIRRGAVVGLLVL